MEITSQHILQTENQFRKYKSICWQRSYGWSYKILRPENRPKWTHLKKFSTFLRFLFRELLKNHRLAIFCKTSLKIFLKNHGHKIFKNILSESIIFRVWIPWKDIPWSPTFLEEELGKYFTWKSPIFCRGFHQIFSKQRTMSSSNISLKKMQEFLTSKWFKKYTILARQP